MRLRAQIVSVVLVPIVGIVAFSALGLSASQKAVRQAQDAEYAVNLTHPLTSLVHELQVERGLSAGFIASAGANFATELPKQRETVDHAIAVYR
ncbi:MAG: nitrate- and nitrite sensing domain-containing protein, partial [Pseudomonadota bacterium]